MDGTGAETMSTTNEVRLRSAGARDLGRVVALNESALPAVNSVPEAYFRGALAWARQDVEPGAAARAVFRVAVDGGDRPVAFLLALGPGLDYASANYRWFSERYDDFLYVDRIVVDAAGRRSGLGSSLYADLRRLALAAVPAVPRICCEVNLRPRNEESLRFHDGQGFRQVGSQETEGGAKEVALLSLVVSGAGPAR